MPEAGIDAPHQHDADVDSADGSSDGTGDTEPSTPSNLAKVFFSDPVTTPNLTEVDLPWVADDQDGTLTSAEDGAGVRLIQAMTCVDEGETNVFMGERRRICSLRQLANKNTNGSFLYDDFQNDVSCSYDPNNVHAEVTLYYHAQKIYSMVIDPSVGVFDRLPGRHDANGSPVPLTVVANYRDPVPVPASALQPTDVAFFVPREHMAMGMAAYQGLLGVKGDVLVFGQGSGMDFAYSGETVYHEFGHAVVNATAKLNQVFADSQGLTNQPRALDEGIANTFGFFGSEQSRLGAYLSDCSGQGWESDAENQERFPGSQTGHPVRDGNPVLGANYSIYQAMIGPWGYSRAVFMRVLLLTLMDLKAKNGDATFADYADAFLRTMDAQGLSAHVEKAETVFTERGLFETARVVNLTGVEAGDQRALMILGAATEGWNTWMSVNDDGSTYPLATAYFQHRIDIVDASQVLISAQVVDISSMTEPGDLDLQVFARTGAQVEYAGLDHQVVKDAIYLPVMSASGPITTATWTFPVDPNSSIYLHFVNRGTSEAVLRSLDVNLTN